MRLLNISFGIVLFLLGAASPALRAASYPGTITPSKPTQKEEVVDGSHFYNLPPNTVKCILIPCPEVYVAFTGVWTGNFLSYDQKIKGFRPFHNTIAYDGKCYRNIENDEVFVVGKKIDHYPSHQGLSARTDTSLIITGVKSDEMSTPFLRTIDKENGLIEYRRVFIDKASEMSIWEHHVAASGQQPEMTFRIIDFRNLGNEEQTERQVYISMKVGPQERPYWEGLIVKGAHSKNAR